MSKKKKNSNEEITKVTFTYETYEDYLEGDEAKKWLRFANGAAMNLHVHGTPFPKFDWKEKKIESRKDSEKEGSDELSSL